MIDGVRTLGHFGVGDSSGGINWSEAHLDFDSSIESHEEYLRMVAGLQSASDTSTFQYSVPDQSEPERSFRLARRFLE